MNARSLLAMVSLLAAVTLLRLAVAALVPLAPDEAYYWTWSRTLQAGYLDHPPMIAWFIRAGTLLAGEGAFGIRLMGPISIALASLLLARAADALFPDRRPGLLAAVLFNATLLVGVGGILVTPDLPLLVFWTAALWALARVHATQDGRWWLAFGVLAGLSLLSKYTAGLLGIGAVLWLLASRPAWRWWRDWRLWAGGALALLVFLPVLLWNAGNGWASFVRQGGRAGAIEPGSALRYLGELVAGQAGLATPLVFVLCVTGVALATRAWWRGDAAAGLLAAMVLPGAALFLWQATGSRVQGNWPGILYPAACIAAAAFLPPRLARWPRPAVALGAVLALAVYIQAAFAPLPLPRRLDPTLARLGGWPELAEAAEQERQRLGAGFVAAEEYGLAAQLALRMPPGIPVVALDPRWRLFNLPRPISGVTGLLVQSERRSTTPQWPGAVPLDVTLSRARGGIEAERYRLFTVETTPGLPPAAVLPRP
ncbi:glycosyltransferase family 39 protein [Falsiroseomonas sp. HC035]|uniref:glycosyltransferase family 39 protein n=1 Tax=Falsiroseomonas sp. HC035 TaxID=3390999 RepID=UPI003D312BE8